MVLLALINECAEEFEIVSIDALDALALDTVLAQEIMIGEEVAPAAGVEVPLAVKRKVAMAFRIAHLVLIYRV